MTVALMPKELREKATSSLAKILTKSKYQAERAMTAVVRPSVRITAAREAMERCFKNTATMTMKKTMMARLSAWKRTRRKARVRRTKRTNAPKSLTSLLTKTSLTCLRMASMKKMASRKKGNTFRTQ